MAAEALEEEALKIAKFSKITTNMDIWVDDPIATPKVISCMIKNKEVNKLILCKVNPLDQCLRLTSLFFMANIIALACSAAFPTIGSKMTLIKAIGRFNASEAP